MAPASNPVIAITMNAPEKPQAELAPRTISGARAPPMCPRPSGKRNACRSGVGGEMFLGVGVEQRRQEAHCDRGDESEARLMGLPVRLDGLHGLS